MNWTGVSVDEPHPTKSPLVVLISFRNHIGTLVRSATSRQPLVPRPRSSGRFVDHPVKLGDRATTICSSGRDMSHETGFIHEVIRSSSMACCAHRYPRCDVASKLDHARRSTPASRGFSTTVARLTAIAV